MAALFPNDAGIWPAVNRRRTWRRGSRHRHRRGFRYFRRCLAESLLRHPSVVRRKGTDHERACGDGVVSANETCEANSAQPCPTTCDDGDPCTKDVVTGTPEQCNVKCSHMPITAPQAGDGCCPSGANAASDGDCETRCGDGVVTGNETCDPNSFMRCETELSCFPVDCLAASLTGSASACTSKCDRRPITDKRGGDGCCPNGANAGNDSDCDTLCGDGAVSGNETCDPGDSRRPCPSESDCQRNSKECDHERLAGSECTARCEKYTITERAAGDGCCPPGANPDNDSDCRTECGDRAVTGDEVCEEGTDEPCPSESDCRSRATDACNPQELRGSACTAHCETVPVTQPNDGDGCCIPANPDTDCGPACGDKKVTGDEVCDTAAAGELKCPSSPAECPTSGSCDRARLEGSDCHDRCVIDTIEANDPGDGCCPAGADHTFDEDCPDV
jgi:hypothetical protein